MKFSTRLILLRHCHTAANAPGEHVPMSGGRTDTRLSPLGETQAALLASKLAAELSGMPVYSSPLSRALKSVASLVAASGSCVRVRQGLREIDCGGLEGMAVSEVKRRFPGHWHENLTHESPDFRWPDGESYREFRCRCIAEVEEIARAEPERTALLVTHAGVISQIVGATQGVSPARWDLYRPGNASLTEVIWGPDGGNLVRFDDRAHLDEDAQVSALTTACATTRPHAG
jgi:broad specificity phosphatase PhoE